MDQDDSIRQLVDDATHGDEVAIGELLNQHLPGLRAYIRLRMGPGLRGKESASDLAQSVCREVLQHLDRYQYRSPQNFRHWLYATALRTVQNKAKFYQRDKRDVAREVTPAEEERSVAELYQTFSTPSFQLAQREQIKRFEEVFAALPEDYQEIITLSRLVGLSHQEIAEHMGRSETATRSLLFRALAALAAALDRGSS